VTCGGLVFGLCNDRKVEIAYELLTEMLKLGVNTNSSSLQCFNNWVLEKGTWPVPNSLSSSKVIISFMQRNGCKPDIITYNVLLNHYCEKGMLDKAEMLIHKMEMCGVNPDGYS
jgi:pentatricopeptide repeat protein